MNQKTMVFSVCLLILCIFLNGCGVRTGIKKKELREQMKAYLEEEYQRGAYVEMPELVGNAGFGYHQYIATAYLLDDPEVEFGVSYYIKEKVFTDGYPTVKIESQAQRDILEELSKYYPKEDILYSHASIDFPSGVRRTEDMTFEGMVRDYGERLGVSVFLTVAMDTFDEGQERERAKAFIQEYYLANKFWRIQLYIDYVKDEYREFYDEKEENANMGDVFAKGHFHSRMSFARIVREMDVSNLDQYIRFKYKDR